MSITRDLQNWMTETCLPLWLERGVDARTGAFVEAMTLEGQPLPTARRAMVQARQIYTLQTAVEMGWLDRARAEKVVFPALENLLAKYSLPSGGFAHAVDVDGKIVNPNPDLYAQSFALFGLASAYKLKPDARWKKRALELMSYLERERSLAEGGYAERRLADRISHEANPHMHLLEAALAWMEADGDPAWRKLADGLVALATRAFVDANGALAELYTSDWQPVRIEGRFLVEPGHQFEWAWLLGRYERLTGVDVSRARKLLVNSAEKHGVSPEQIVVDEVWSDFTPKASSARFWPQCERMKAMAGQSEGLKAAASLKLYFSTPTPGLWFDRRDESGKFIHEPVRASGLYHIAGAIAELARKPD